MTRFSYINSTALILIFDFYYKSLIISRIKNKQTLIFYFNVYFSVGFHQNGKTEYNYVYVFIKYFRAIVPYCTIKSNILFLLLNIDKSLEQRTGFGTFIFATGARLKQPVYVCIGQHFVWDIYLPLLSKRLIGFRLRPSRELVWHLSTQMNNGLLAV